MEVSSGFELRIRVRNTRNFGPNKHGPQLLEPATTSFRKYVAKHSEEITAMQSNAGAEKLTSVSNVRVTLRDRLLNVAFM